MRTSSLPRRVPLYKSERQKLIDQVKRAHQRSQKIWSYHLTENDNPLAKIREEGFINTHDTVYLQSYAIENLMELISREELNRHPNLLFNQPEIKRLGRA
jgi:hypothetical protein